MGIETWNSVHNGYNPAWRATDALGRWCESKAKLHRNTVKPFTSLSQVVERTALARISPQTPVDERYLTETERAWVRGDSPEIIRRDRLAIVDIDGVLTDVWPTLVELWRTRRFTRGSLREAAEEMKPSWVDLRPLGDISRRVDKLILWTSRFSPLVAPPLFDNFGSFDAFPFLSLPRIEEIESHFGPGKVKVIAGRIKGLGKSGFEQVTEAIEGLDDPYVVYVGSSIFDINRFRSLINYLREREMPFDRFVFCTSGHLVL